MSLTIGNVEMIGGGPITHDISAAACGITVGVSRIRESAVLPTYATSGSAAFDLSAAVDVMAHPRQPVLIPTGLVFAVPDGYFLGIFARSSTPKRGLMVANGVGVLDSDYRGEKDECCVLVVNFTPTPVLVRAGYRIAQGIVLPCPRVKFEEYEPGTESRGGFGSTGR